MFSSTRIVASVAVVALGSSLALVNGVLGPTSTLVSAPGAESPSPSPQTTQPLAPVEFSGRIVFGQCSGGEKIELPGNVRRTIGASCTGAFAQEMSDPRLEGKVTITVTFDLHRPALDGSTPGTTLWNGRIDIETEEGMWRGVPGLLFDFTDGSSSAMTYVFAGEGEFEGLTAVAEMETGDSKGWDLRGFIIDGDIPAAPERTSSD